MPEFDVALLTDARYENPPPEKIDWYVGHILEEDGYVQKALEGHGLSSVRVDWARHDFDWSSVRCAVFRTTWDYFFRFDEFSAWLDRAATQTRLINPVEQIRWNMDKHYLADIAGRGVRTVTTHFIEQGTSVSVPEVLEELGWDEAVLKPCVSGAARHTYRVNRENGAQRDGLLAELLAEESMMLQPFQQEIVDFGELTLVVLGGQCTHAVRKIAKAGDFRVQDDHGGTVHPHEASPEEIEFATRAAAACEPLPAYARVDVVRDNDGQLAVMELELVEPELFLRFAPPAAEVLADHLASLLGKDNQ